MPETSLQELNPKYEVGDLVRIVEEPWSVHAGDVAIITRITEVNGKPFYDFVIPESRGGMPEQFVERLVARGVSACLKIASKT